jgi:putative spermidine/putrescine transport system substrate-binding protein
VSKKMTLMVGIASAALCASVVATHPAAAATKSVWATATSAKAGGGLKALAAACTKEGKMNIIADPHDWANYGEIITGFAKKYKVKMNEANPNGSSQDEINAANQLRGTTRAPDAFDLGSAVAYANLNMFGAYKVSNWKDIPAAFKEPNGFLTKDYGGFMAIGYNSSLGTVTSISDLLKPAFQGKVALNGDPTKANAGLMGVFLASVANGGSINDISKGVAFFKQLKDVGNFINVDPSPATIASGQTPVVFDWDYNQAASVKELAAKGVTWKVFIPSGALVGAYYNQAININAPHPACARQWMEYLYSPAGQNAWLKGGSRPVLAEVMAKNGTINKAAYAALGKVVGAPQIPSLDQAKAASTYLVANWAAAVGTR